MECSQLEAELGKRGITKDSATELGFKWKLWARADKNLRLHLYEQAKELRLEDGRTPNELSVAELERECEVRGCFISLHEDPLNLLGRLIHSLSNKQQSTDGGGAEGGGGGGGDGAEGGAAWPVLVDASRRQFALLLSALAKEPLAPAELVHPTAVGGF